MSKCLISFWNCVDRDPCSMVYLLSIVLKVGFLFLSNKLAGQPIRTEDKGTFSILELIQTSDKMAPVFQKRFAG